MVVAVLEGENYRKDIISSASKWEAEFETMDIKIFKYIQNIKVYLEGISLL
ncbi:MAG: hypothetical protein ACLRHD_00360 [Thomasclavelia spiroformis]